MVDHREDADLDARVTRLERIHEVEVAIQTYIRAYDSRDEPLLRSVFDDDAELVITALGPLEDEQEGHYEGFEEIVGLYRGIWRDRELLNHHVTNQVGDVDGDRAVATSYYLVFAEAAGQSTLSGGYYERHLARRAGSWVHTYLGIGSQFRAPADDPSFRQVIGHDRPRPAPQDHPQFPVPLFPDR